MNTNKFVLCLCTGYKQSVYNRYTLSLIQSGYQGRIVLFIYDSDTPNVEQLVHEHRNQISFEVVATATPTMYRDLDIRHI